MTEAEWLGCDEVLRLLQTETRCWERVRPWLLFSLACLNPLRSHLFDHRLITALEVIERAAEGKCGSGELEHACEEANSAHQAVLDDPSEQRWFYVHECATRAVVLAAHPGCLEFTPGVADATAQALSYLADGVADATAQALSYLADGLARVAREKANSRHVALVHEIFGNPFRPVPFEPAWRTTDVLLLARGIYEEKAFDRMSILADALQDAGCTSADILNHLRDSQATHVRGCWALDLVLGKE
jgi:hypothetical protein